MTTIADNWKRRYCLHIVLRLSSLLFSDLQQRLEASERENQELKGTIGVCCLLNPPICCFSNLSQVLETKIAKLEAQGRIKDARMARPNDQRK